MHFQMIKVIFLIITVAVLALAKKQKALHGHSADTGLMNFISRSSDVLQRDPEQSVKCFSYYIPLLNQLAEDYESAYTACITAADSAVSDAGAATAPQRTELATSAEDACAAVSACQNDSKSPAEDVFQCYATAGTNSAKALYNVSSVATVQLAELQEQIRQIRSNESFCITTNRLLYEQESGAAYEEFNKCILGEAEVPKPTTAQPPSSPELPASSEEPPASTEAPASSEEPESSSENPTSTEIPEEDLLKFLKRFKHFKV